MTPSDPSGLNVRPHELTEVIRSLRGVRDVVLHLQADDVVRVEVVVRGDHSDQTHWLELLKRTVHLLAASAFSRQVVVRLRPDDAVLDDSMD